MATIQSSKASPWQKATLLAVFCIGLIACAKPQSITIETTPSGAAISVEDEYIGKSPVVYDLDDVNNISRLRIVAERHSHESTLKLIKKRHDGLFPDRVFLKLDPSMTAAEIKSSSGSSMGSSDQQQGTTIQGPTIQGPTIVVPGSGAQVVPPAPASSE